MLSIRYVSANNFIIKKALHDGREKQEEIC